MEPFEPIDPDSIERLECIGRGSYGDVFRGLDTKTGQQVAIKVIDLEDIEDDIEDIHKEISALAGCRSEHITRYYGAVMRPGSSELLIIMELLACSVADLLAAAPLPEASIAYVLRSVVAALGYLHGEARIHRDIKAANVLLSSGGGVRISDFGVSGQLTGTMGFRRRTFVGTPYWMAPEVIESSEEGYSTSADIWSVGITAIEMALAAPPHAELHPMRVLFIIPKDPPPRLEGPFSDEFKDFVAVCLQKDPAQRPSARELLGHPFIAGAVEAPPGLTQLVGEYAQRKRPVVPQRGASPNDYSTGTLPTWDFGNKAAATTGRHATALGTLRSADSGGTRDARSLTGGSAGSLGGAAAASGGGPDSLAAAGRQPAAAAAAVVGTGTVARADGRAVQQQLASTAAGGGDAADAGYGDTVQAASGAAAAAANNEVLQPTSSGAPPGDVSRGVFRRRPSLAGLSVDVGHAPGGGVAAGLPPGSGSAPEVTILARFSRVESGATAGEGDAALSRLLLPALRSLAPGAVGPEQVAVDAATTALAQLERQLPGSSARLLSEAMLQLSISDSPQLGKLLAAARSIFGASGSGPGAGASGAAAAGVAGGTVPGQVPAGRGGGIGTPAAIPGLPGLPSVPGPEGAHQGKNGAVVGPDLGLLGNFLLARWREDAARASAAAARSRAPAH